MTQLKKQAGLKDLLAIKIRDVNGFEEFSNNGRNSFSDVWNKIAFSIGIRDQLQTGELTIIFEFMESQFKSLSLAYLTASSTPFIQDLEFKIIHLSSLL